MALSIFLRKVVCLSFNENTEAIQILAHEMKNVAQTVVDNAKFDRTVKARVIAKVNMNNKYLVLINGQEYVARSYMDLSIGDICYVTIIQNDYNNIIINMPVVETNMEYSDFELETEMIDI